MSPSAASARLALWLRVEYDAVAKAAPRGRELSGIYILPSHDEHEWHAMIAVHQASSRPAHTLAVPRPTSAATSQSFYKGGVFRFTVEFPHTYPVVAPTVRFTPAIAHPLVSADGTLCLDGELKPWSREKLSEHGEAPMVAVLRYVKRIFYRDGLVATENADHVRACVAESHSAALATPEPGCRLRMRPFDPDVHNPVLVELGCRASRPDNELGGVDGVD